MESPNRRPHRLNMNRTHNLPKPWSQGWPQVQSVLTWVKNQFSTVTTIICRVLQAPQRSVTHELQGSVTYCTQFPAVAFDHVSGCYEVSTSPATEVTLQFCCGKPRSATSDKHLGNPFELDYQTTGSMYSLGSLRPSPTGICEHLFKSK